MGVKGPQEMGVRGRGVRGGAGILPVCVQQMEHCWTSDTAGVGSRSTTTRHGRFRCQVSVWAFGSRMALGLGHGGSVVYLQEIVKGVL